VHIIVSGKKYYKSKSSPYKFLSILRKNPPNCALFFMVVEYQSLVWPTIKERISETYEF